MAPYLDDFMWVSDGFEAFYLWNTKQTQEQTNKNIIHTQPPKTQTKQTNQNKTKKPQQPTTSPFPPTSNCYGLT